MCRAIWPAIQCRRLGNDSQEKSEFVRMKPNPIMYCRDAMSVDTDMSCIQRRACACRSSMPNC